MSKTTVQTVADELERLINEQQNIVVQMRTGQVGRRRAYELLKKVRSDINILVGRLGSM